MHPVASLHAYIKKKRPFHSFVYTNQAAHIKHYLHLSVWLVSLIRINNERHSTQTDALEASLDLICRGQTSLTDTLSSMSLCTSCWTRDKSLVQRFLFDPDRGTGEGLAVPQVATQDVLTELGRVDSPTAGRLDAEAFLEETLEDLQTDGQLFECFR